jgi:hypothetical protein
MAADELYFPRLVLPLWIEGAANTHFQITDDAFEGECPCPAKAS